MSLTAQPNPGTGVLREVDLRRARRYSDKGSMIQASWIDAEGNVNVGMVRVVNISEGGLALELPVVPQQTAMVRIQSDRHKLTGTATVRHVTAQGSRCVVGLEFANGMRWQPPWDRGEGPEELSPPADAAVRGTVTKSVGLTGIPVVRPRPAELRPLAAEPPKPAAALPKPAAETAQPVPETPKPAAKAEPETGPKPEPATADSGKPGELKRLNGALPMPPAETPEAVKPSETAVAKAPEGAAGKAQETTGHTPTAAVLVEVNPAKATGSTSEKSAAAGEMKPAAGTVSRDALPVNEPDSPAVAAGTKPANAVELKAQEAAPTPASPATTVESPAVTPAAEPKAAEPAAEKALETLPAAAPETPEESKLDELADFWGWTKQ